LEAQRKAGSICAVNFVLRYHDGNRLMKQWCDSGEIGRLRAIRIVDAWWGADHRGVYPGRGVGLLKHDGSVIVAEGIHQADLVRWFSGSEFGPLHCIGTAIHHGEYPDHLILTASLSNGVLVTIENSWAYTVRSKDGLMDRQTDLIGEDGVAKWYESLHRLVLYGRDRTEELETTEGKHFAAIYGDLIASIHAGKPVAGLPTLDDAAKAMEVVSRAEKVSRFSSVSASHPNEAATSAPG